MRKKMLQAALTALVLALAAAGPVQAQFSISYGRGYGYGGYSYGSPWFSYGRYGGPYYGGPYYGRGWGYPYGYGGYYPYRSGISISVGTPYYGYYPRYGGYYVTETPVFRSERAGSYRSAYGPAENRAMVRVTLPSADARVWFEDTLTKQEGRNRTFMTPELEPGHSYTYVVKAAWKRDGKEMTQEKEVRVRAGEETAVAFEDKKPRPDPAGLEPRELRDLDRPAPARDTKPVPKKDVPPPPD